MADISAFAKFYVTHGWSILAVLVVMTIVSLSCIRLSKTSAQIRFKIGSLARSTFNALLFLTALMLLSQATSIGGLHKALGELHAYAASGGDPSIKIDPEEVNALWKLTARAWRTGAVALVCTAVGCWLQARWLKEHNLKTIAKEHPTAVDAPMLS